MNKTKVIIICLLVFSVVFTFFSFLKVKAKREYREKIVLVKEIHKVLDHLMVDLGTARENTVKDVPADGLWHDRIAFIHPKRGISEYFVRNGQMCETYRGMEFMIGDNISDLRVRHQKETPDLFEIQMTAHKDVSVVFNLRIRIRQ